VLAARAGLLAVASPRRNSTRHDTPEQTKKKAVAGDMFTCRTPTRRLSSRKGRSKIPISQPGSAARPLAKAATATNSGNAAPLVKRNAAFAGEGAEAPALPGAARRHKSPPRARNSTAVLAAMGTWASTALSSSHVPVSPPSRPNEATARSSALKTSCARRTAACPARDGSKAGRPGEAAVMKAPQLRGARATFPTAYHIPCSPAQRKGGARTKAGGRAPSSPGPRPPAPHGCGP